MSDAYQSQAFRGVFRGFSEGFQGASEEFVDIVVHCGMIHEGIMTVIYVLLAYGNSNYGMGKA